MKKLNLSVLGLSVLSVLTVSACATQNDSVAQTASATTIETRQLPPANLCVGYLFQGKVQPAARNAATTQTDENQPPSFVITATPLYDVVGGLTQGQFIQDENLTGNRIANANEAVDFGGASLSNITYQLTQVYADYNPQPGDGKTKFNNSAQTVAGRLLFSPSKQCQTSAAELGYPRFLNYVSAQMGSTLDADSSTLHAEMRGCKTSSTVGGAQVANLVGAIWAYSKTELFSPVSPATFTVVSSEPGDSSDSHFATFIDTKGGKKEQPGSIVHNNEWVHRNFKLDDRQHISITPDPGDGIAASFDVRTNFTKTPGSNASGDISVQVGACGAATLPETVLTIISTELLQRLQSDLEINVIQDPKG